MLMTVDDAAADRYDELAWFDTRDLAYIVSIVRKSDENGKLVENAIDSVRIKGKLGKDVFSTMFKLVDDSYSLMCEWLKIDPGKFVICFTTGQPSNDIIGTEMIIEHDDASTTMEREIVTLLNIHVESFKSRDEQGEDPVIFTAKIASRIIFLMLYDDIIMNKKEIADQYVNIDIIRDIVDNVAIDAARDMAKWL